MESAKSKNEEKTPSAVKFKFSTPVPRGNGPGENLPDYQPGETHELPTSRAKIYKKRGWGEIVQ